MTDGASATALAWLDGLGAWAFRAGWQAAVLCGAVALLLWLFGRRLSPGWRFGLWGLVLARLAVPTVVEVAVVREGSGSGEAARVARADDTSRGVVIGVETVVVDHHESARSADTTRDRASANPPVVRRPPRIDWLLVRRWSIAVWLAGVAVLALRVLGSSVRLSRSVRRMKPVDDPRVLVALVDCSRMLRLRGVPTARELPGPGAPALVGFVRPVVLLPAGVADAMSDDELRLIVLHELAHVRRRDVLVNWLTTLVCVAHWPNPIGWLVGWRMRVERELACDEIVLGAAAAGRPGNGQGGSAYARTILKLVEALSGAAPRPASATLTAPRGAVGILEGKAQIHRRLVMIARYDTRTSTRRRPVLAGTLALLVGGAALCGGAKPKEATGEPGRPPAQGAPTGGAVPGLPGGGAVPGAPAPDLRRTPSVGGYGAAYDPGTATGAPTGALSEAEEAANAELAKRLAKNVPEVNFSGQGLADVFDFFRDATGVDVVVPWPILETAGISRDMPVTFRLKDAKPASDVLSLMFRSMGDVLSFRLEKGAVVVTLGTGFGQMGGPAPVPSARETATLVTRVYDVGELVAPPLQTVPGVDGAPGEAAPTGGGGGGGGRGRGGFGPDGAPPTSIAQLIELITSTVDPASWRNAGGNLGSITAFRNKLVVKNTESAHREIAELLMMIRDNPDAKKKDGGR